MSEENPVFKVTDRRLFNADGSPREIEEEHKAEASAAKTTESAPTPEVESTAGSTSTAQSAAAAVDLAEPTNESDSRQSEAPATDSESAEPVSDEADAQSDIPGADDPASFINFLMSIASNAAAALGMMEHPVTGQRSLEPELGKHWIDVLGMLQKKTQGNLSSQEKEIFEGLLADLRMQYVSLNSASQAKSSGGFTGSDITGGK